MEANGQAGSESRRDPAEPEAPTARPETPTFTPCTPATAKEESFLVRHEKSTGWFSVKQLLATTGKVVTSTIVGSMSGRREIQAALDPRPPGEVTPEHDYRKGKDEIWIDYIADTGDGWDATSDLRRRRRLHARDGGPA